ncbi:MAG: hypothetical protein WD801_03500 [Gemmatimonadaceae bacterium]
MHTRSRLGWNWCLLPAALVAALSCSDLTPTAPTFAPVATGPAFSTTLTEFFGPARFTRQRGQPFTEAVTISTAGYAAPFELRVQNGNANGTNRVSAATVLLDGIPVLTPSDFNQQAAGWTFAVSPGATATLAVTLAGAPGSFLEIALAGQRGATLFCPAGGPGAYLDLQAAINATDPDGTIVVCDGEWDISEAHVNRPLTIRSQNPGGATLGDTLSSGGNQGSPPAIWVDSVPSGLVRFVDIGFAMRGRALVIGRSNTVGVFDRVEIDSAWFVGRGTTEFAIETFFSPVPGAVTEITHSHFRGVDIAVFAVGATPTNVRRSRFDSSAVLYSTSFGGGVNYGLGTVEDNIFNHCQRPGPSRGCITVFSVEGAVTIARNRITQMGHVLLQSAAITVSRGVAPPGSPPVGHLVIEDNEIVSHATGAAPTTPGGWALNAGVSIDDPFNTTVTHTIRRNRIVDAFTGIIFARGPADARDNVILGGVFAFSQPTATNIVTFQRNDLAGALSSFVAASGAVSSNYQCNWWGSASGPTTPPPTVPASRYTPFSTVPIANQPSVVCP